MIAIKTGIFWFVLHAVVWVGQAGVAGMFREDYCSGVFLCNTPVQQIADAWADTNISLDPRDVLASVIALFNLLIAFVKFLTVDYEVLRNAPSVLGWLSIALRFAGGLAAAVAIGGAIGLALQRR